MIGEVALIVTAIATAATALFALLQFVIIKRQSDPYIAARIETLDDGRTVLHLRIHPAERAMHFAAISVAGARVVAATYDYDPWKGTTTYGVPHAPPPRNFELDISVPPARLSPAPVEQSFFVESRKSQSSWAIALHTRFMCLPVRYKTKIKTTSEM